VGEIGLSVKRLQARHHRAIDAALAPLGVSLVQWDALRHLSENPSASLHDLAQLTFQTDQSFGALASRMVDRGLIERAGGPGRAVRHRLTPVGDEVRRAGGALVSQVLQASFGALSPDELDVFDRLLVSLLGAPAGAGPGPAPKSHEPA
jgi:DNA-binding MarR family transcriptional regulator